MFFTENQPTSEIARHKNLSVYIIRKIIKEYRKTLQENKNES